jgi:GxxExxY protein
MGFGENENMHENDISFIIRGAAFKIHTALGPGLLESAYEATLKYEIEKTGLRVHSQVGMGLEYEEIKLDVGYRADLVVENKVIVEIKSVETLRDVHKKQLLTYLKLSGMKLGLLINFNVLSLKTGIIRIVNNL